MNRLIQNVARRMVWVLGVSSLILHPSSLVRADGGTVRLCQRAGSYQVAVFTSPTPFRAGPVDISVFVQDPVTGECRPEAQVTVRLTARGSGQTLEYPATSEAATNKLFHAAVFDLPEPGWWDVEVSVKGPQGPASIRFQLEAGEVLPRWLDLWPWYTWPALAVALFGLHQMLSRRPRPALCSTRPTARCASTRSPASSSPATAPSTSTRLPLTEFDSENASG